MICVYMCKYVYIYMLYIGNVPLVYMAQNSINGSVNQQIFGWLILSYVSKPI